MEINKHKPIDGLLNITKKEISNADPISVFVYVENKINPAPKGRAKDLALLFYVINVLNKSGLPFYVKGGLISQYFLEDSARPTKDLDIITPISGDEFYQSLDKYLNTLNTPLKYKITKYKSIKADDKYYYDVFDIELSIYYQSKLYAQVIIDGVSSEVFDKIIPVKLPAPNFIEKDFVFSSVPIEYVLAEKITAITNELKRPYKHLVDVYALIQTYLNIDKLKKYLLIISNNDNKVRKSLGKAAIKPIYIIKEDKIFTESFFIPLIQSGLNLTVEEMTLEVNSWLKNNLY